MIAPIIPSKRGQKRTSGHLEQSKRGSQSLPQVRKSYELINGACYPSQTMAFCLDAPAETGRGSEASPTTSKNMKMVVILFSSSLLMMAIPFLVLRRGFDLEIVCFNEDLEDPEPTCAGQEHSLGRVVYRYINFLVVIANYLFLGLLTLSSSGRSYRRYLIAAPLMVIIGVVFAISNEVSGSLVILIGLVLSMAIGPILDGKQANKGGVIFGVAALVMYAIAQNVPPLIIPHLHKTIVPGFKVIGLVPLFVQIMQGTMVFVADRVDPYCEMNKTNSDSFIILSKILMSWVNGFKCIILLDAARQGDYIVPFISSILGDVLGRIQIWRYAYRRVKFFFTSVPMRKMINPLAEYMLCSELDMDYAPWSLLLLVKILRSPINSMTFGIYHSKNSYLDLKEDTIINASYEDLFIVLAVLIIGDLLTIILYQKAKFFNIYRLRAVYPKNVAFLLVGTFSLARSNLTYLLGLGHVINKAQWLLGAD